MSEVPAVRADGDLLREVLLNIVINGLQAMPDGGTLFVSTGADGKSVRCAVRDTGAGIAAEHMEDLFDPFFTTKPDGTGLGLSIAHRIVTAVGGRIEVESSPNEGATFTIVLPTGGFESDASGDDSCG